MMPRGFLLFCFGFLPLLVNAQGRDPLIYGRAYLAEGENTAAIENYQEASRINPFDPVALNNLGVARAASGDYQAALDLFARAEKIAPKRQDIAENHRHLQSWMEGQLRGGSAAYRALDIQTAPSNATASMLIPEPPALWQSASGKLYRQPFVQKSDSEQGMSIAPKNRKKTKKKRHQIVCAPKVSGQ